MKKKLGLIVIMTGCLIGLAVYVLGGTPKAALNANTEVGAGDPDLAKFAQYRRWTLVNPEPQLMNRLSAAACALIPGRSVGSPHLDKYISVFVNEAGRSAMMTQSEPKYPEGSMIVKEKLATRDSLTPELLTAMLKREPGYNSESGDWEYLVLDGSATKIVERGKLEQCNSCHLSYKLNDYVTRTYLPKEVSRQLK